MHAVKKKDNLMMLMLAANDFITFVDGSWSIDSKGYISASMGGIIFNKSKQIVFIFSGPTSANNAFEAEKMLMFFS